MSWHPSRNSTYRSKKVYFSRVGRSRPGWYQSVLSWSIYISIRLPLRNFTAQENGSLWWLIVRSIFLRYIPRITHSVCNEARIQQGTILSLSRRFQCSKYSRRPNQRTNYGGNRLGLRMCKTNPITSCIPRIIAMGFIIARQRHIWAIPNWMGPNLSSTMGWCDDSDIKECWNGMSC